MEDGRASTPDFFDPFLIIKELYSASTFTTMDLFEIPDDYRPEKPLTNQEAEEITEYLKGHPLFLKELPQDIS